MKLPDSSKISAGAIAAMRDVAARLILPRFQKLAAGDIRSKTHPGDLVTVADVESEQALTKLLPELLPGSLVIGEEAASADAAVLDHLKRDEAVWIIDPVDGTANFVNGEPRFAVIVALVSKGETLMGFIHDPITLRTLWAQAGAGAWLEHESGKHIRVHCPPPPSDQLSALTAGIYSRELTHLKGRFARVIRLGSAAHDYWSLTDGRMHVLNFKRLKPWDHAAGLLIHREAGGFNRMLSGVEYAPAEPEQAGILCAPSEKIWREIVGLHQSGPQSP